MTDKKILYAGCSFTANSPDSGFNLENHSKYHWTSRIALHYQKSFDNLAIGGMSNKEIYYRALERCLYQKYDLVIIMWSSLARQWIYFNENNIDDFTGLTPSYAFGFNSASTEVDLFYKLYYTKFQNCYIELKHWLLDAISLGCFLKSISQPFVFVKGFDNFISDFTSILDQKSFYNLSDELKKILDFDNRPDDYLLEKVDNINSLIKQTKDLPWVNLLDRSFYSMAEDVADDGMHPGPETNKKMAELIIRYIDNQNLL